MPAIKKKWIKANQGEVKSADDAEKNGDAHAEVLAEEDRDLAQEEAPSKGAVSPVKAKKRPLDVAPGGMLRGLDGEVLSQKRKRFVPPAETKLNEWLESNLEKRNDVKVSAVHLYKYYTELCQGDASDILDVTAFNRMIKAKFGKTFGIKESSIYKTILKEHKLDEQKKKASSGYKLKEIAHEAINHFGNPYGGVRFCSLKQYVATKYPFLQIDQRPKMLRRTLEMGVNCGQMDLVKGIGMAGFYRLPGAEPPKPKVKTGKEEKKGSKEEGAAEETVEADSAGSDAQEPKEKEDSAETGEKESKEKPKKPKKTEKCDLNSISHGDPQKIEDIFPLAITFQSAPKTASVIRVRRYIQDQYKETVPDNRWRKAVEGGADKGHWEYISGSGITGRLHLLMDDFDPDSEHLEDMICAGIIACHEPKAASGNQIKKYVSRYHPNFRVDEKPDRFKKALIRAADKSMIVQVTGLGANGSFQLCDTFVPSPRVLSGENASSDEEESSDEDEPVYIPKATKSRGATKKPAVVSAPARKPPGSASKRAAPTSKQTKQKTAKTGSARAKGSAGGKSSSSKRRSSKVVKKDDSSLDEDDEVDEEVEYTPRKSKSRGGDGPAKSASPTKKGKKSAGKPKPSRRAERSQTPSDDEWDQEELKVEYTPRKSQSRGGPARTPQAASPQKDQTKSGGTDRRSRPSKSGGNISLLAMDNGSDAADEDSEGEVVKSKSPSRGAKEKKGKKKGKKRS